MELTPRFPAFLHGGDYNPDQWLDHPDILRQDMEYMKKAHVNCVSLGIFAWARLEPEEGRYDFVWLDDIIERLWASGIHVSLATPSGARPAWMARKYPEVLRTERDFQRRHFGGRHNHCPSSPVYREKVQAMDAALARRYASHPAVILWHISNEFSGDCYCELCQEKFRDWLREKYGTLDELNRAWYTGFWSMRYSDWREIEAPSPRGQNVNPTMLLDWRRFSTHQCTSFIEMERDTVKAVCPELPVTTNLMERFYDYDYFRLSQALDFVSWDAYPAWHAGDNSDVAIEFAMNHDMMRSFLKKPFLLMESTPSLVNWKDVNRLKRPGMHLLSSMQAVAHGAQSVMYFQWRKGRGGAEMFHGAVVSHDMSPDTRVFRDVTEVGVTLERLAPLYHEPMGRPQVCFLYDWDSRWAMSTAQMGLRSELDYHAQVMAHYAAFWKLGIPVDFRDPVSFDPAEGYDLVVAPELFLFREGIEDRLRAYVQQGGTLVMSMLSGTVDENQQAFLGHAPHGLTDVFGMHVQELDALYPEESNPLSGPDGLSAHQMCELLENEGAEVYAAYTRDFYAGTPCITRHDFGLGQAWYVGARLEDGGLDTLYADIASRLQLHPSLPDPLPHGVTARRRGSAVFVQNYSGEEATLTLSRSWQDMLSGRTVTGTVQLPVNGLLILRAQA